jgi:hypothetical protein
VALYAAQQPRRLRQIALDVFVVLWIGFWAWQGWATWSSIHSLTEPTQKAQEASTGMAENLDSAGDVLGAVPLLGDAAAEPFHRAAEQAAKLAEGATESEDAITSLAWKLGLSLALVPTVLLLAFHGPPRLRFIRESSQARAYLDSGGAPDLLALRALSTQPLDVLMRVHSDPSGAWRQGDLATIHTLAAMELHRVGLEAPRTAAVAPDPRGPTR